MTLSGRLVALFPVFQLALVALSLGWLVVSPSALGLVALLGALYLLPVIAYRAQSRLVEMKLGVTNLSSPKYSAWWGAYQFQRIFVTLPGLEGILRLVPGLFSAWLRLWGARVGRRVLWTPKFELLDRTHLDIGDDVVMGHDVLITSHLIRPGKKGPILFFAPVTIESGAFIGGRAVVGPGATIESGVFLPAGTHVHPAKRVSA